MSGQKCSALSRIYVAEPVWWRIAVGAVLLLTGLYVRKFAKVT
jgi:hypothetical protein